MGDQLRNSGSSNKSEMTGVVSKKRVSKIDLITSSPKALQQGAYRHIVSLSNGGNASGAAGHAAVFLLKVAALETLRRISSSKCPYIWRGLQTLQLLCYPPFKWIQRWVPFKGLIKGMQMLSRPLLVLSVATAVTDQLECINETSDNNTSDTDAYSDTHSESPSVQSSSDTRILEGFPQSLASEDWMIQLHKELESQGISLPQRINEDELRRFYTAANGDFSCLLLSIKKTIRWRETYGILSEEELEMWSNLVFWHGFDVEQRPCLIVRLGLACSNLPSHERPRFAQAVISQVEHGIIYLVNTDDPRITVLVDCEGLSPLKIPMQMMRTCSSLLQDHFPNRLGCLFVIRLPPVVRVIAQTFIQVLRPTTRKKLKIHGDTYHRVLSEYIQAVPSCLGGKCTCMKCSDIGIRTMQRPCANEMIEPNAYVGDGENLPSPRMTLEADIAMNGNCDQVLRTAVVGILMLWILIALIAGFYDPESSPFFSP